MASQKHHTPKWIIVIFLWIFPFAAWFLMWREKEYHTWFPSILFINGAIMSVFFLIYGFFILPLLLRFYTIAGILKKPSFSFELAMAFVIYGILQILFSIPAKSKAKKHIELSDRLLVVTTVFLVADYLILSIGPGSEITSIMVPLYGILTHITASNF